ncbi:hypothetical protein [Pseudoalteromonas spongiae]|uniref:MSHA biogenesis protein MshI n=1 Tax=Pseudoalteromonas spongiae TaxID=298657 RepID=A0ABU8EN22_9GAMM
MKNLLARIPWLNKNNNGSLLAGIYIASDKVVSVILHRVSDSFEIKHTVVEAFQSETEKLPALNRVLAKLPSGAQVCLVMPESAYQWVQIEKPNLPEQDIVTSLPWTIKELVSLEPSDIIADYYDASLKQGGQNKINVVVTSRSLLMPMLKLINDNDIDLQTITTQEMMFCDLVTQDNAAHMLVSQQFGNEPSIHIIRDGELLLSRKLRGLIPLAEQPLNQLKLGLLDALGLELQRSLDYFESQLKQPPIKSLQLAIPNFEINGIAQELSQFFPAKVLAFEPRLALCLQQNTEVQLAIAAALSEDLRGDNEDSH